MQFSMIFEAQLTRPTIEREHQVIEDCVEQAVYGEAMGFDRVWAVEHHSLKWYAHMTAPEIFLSWVAARTSRIRIGHSAVCMPFNYNHPVRVAERAAMLDVLSRGRLDVAAARGATEHEASAMGVDVSRTEAELDEALQIFGHVWEKDEFEWHGDLLEIPPHAILPRPVQVPHPPLFLACTRRESIQKAAEMGIGALTLGFSGPKEVAELKALYDGAIAQRDGSKLVSSVINDHFSALCPTIVLDDGEAAVRYGSRGQRFFAESIAHWSRGAPPPDEDEEARDDPNQLTESFERIKTYLNQAAIPHTPAKVLPGAGKDARAQGTFDVDQAYGTAERAIEWVEALADAGVDEVMCLIQMGTVPQEVCMETIRQWGTKVIPHFRTERG